MNRRETLIIGCSSLAMAFVRLLSLLKRLLERRGGRRFHPIASLRPMMEKKKEKEDFIRVPKEYHSTRFSMVLAFRAGPYFNERD